MAQAGVQSDIPTGENEGKGSTHISPLQQPWRWQDQPRRYKWKRGGSTLSSVASKLSGKGPGKSNPPEAQGDHDSQKQSPRGAFPQLPDLANSVGFSHSPGDGEGLP